MCCVDFTLMFIAYWVVFRRIKLMPNFWCVLCKQNIIYIWKMSRCSSLKKVYFVSELLLCKLQNLSRHAEGPHSLDLWIYSYFIYLFIFLLDCSWGYVIFVSYMLVLKVLNVIILKLKVNYGKGNVWLDI